MSALYRVALVVVASGCLLGPGCTHSCTLIGGEDGLYVRVEVTGGKLPPGDYTFAARVGAVELTADGTMISDSGFKDGSSEGIVEGKHLALDGSLYAASGMIAVRFREGRGPTMVTLGVRHDGATLGEQTYAPKYTASFPNGEDCGPELQQATGNLVVAAP